MEALLPPHVLHGDDDCNQLVAPFNTESEISHTARSSSDSRTDYDGWPLDRAISGPAWTPSSSYLQPTWAPQPERKKGASLQRAFMEEPEPAPPEASPMVAFATRHNAASITQRPSSSQETWALQPDSNCDSRVSSAVQHPLAVVQPQRNDGLRSWLRDKAGVAVRFLDDVVEVLTAEQVDGPEDLAFFATTPAFDAKLAATTAAH